LLQSGAQELKEITLAASFLLVWAKPAMLPFRRSGVIELSDDFRCWPNPDLLWDHRLRRLLEDKRTRYARREIFRFCPYADMNIVVH
jgi:hypothetical protein